MYAEVTGRVITSEGATEYALRWKLDDNGVMTISRRAHERPADFASPASLSGLLSELQTLDGQNWGCAVDGRSVLVDGVVHGRRFAFSAGNPDFCDDDRSRLAVRVLNELGPSIWLSLFGDEPIVTQTAQP